MENETKTNSKAEEIRNFKLKACTYLASITGISAMVGFGTAVVVAKRKDPSHFNKGIMAGAELTETGASLAMRALGWGTLYAFIGCGMIGFSIWKLSGAENMEEFKTIMGSHLPKIPKNDPPQGRTEFEGVADLLDYIFEEKKDK